MENSLSNSGNYESNTSDIIDDDFCPINSNWRIDYYRKVFWKRIKAYFFDLIIIWIATFTILISVIFFFSLFLNDDQVLSIFVVLYFLLLFSIPVLISILESSKWKGAFGKRIMKIEVSDEFGKPISFWKSIWRNLLKGITFYICLTVIGFFIQRYYFLKSGKLIHDHWSNTVIGERLNN